MKMLFMGIVLTIWFNKSSIKNQTKSLRFLLAGICKSIAYKYKERFLMKRVPLLMLLLFIMLLSTAFPVEVFTRRQLLEDIDFLVGKIESLFYDPWRKIDEEVFRDLVEEAKSSLKDGMTLSEFFLVAGRITDRLKDQHSGMSLPGEVDVLPFKTREVQGRALVIESGSLIPVGSFILG